MSFNIKLLRFFWEIFTMMLFTYLQVILSCPKVFLPCLSLSLFALTKVEQTKCELQNLHCVYTAISLFLTAYPYFLCCSKEKMNIV